MDNMMEIEERAFSLLRLAANGEPVDTLQSRLLQLMTEYVGIVEAPMDRKLIGFNR